MTTTGVNRRKRAYDHRNKQSQRPLLTLEEARRRQPAIDWSQSSVYKPSFTGIKVDEDVPLEEIVPYIDWTPFFHTWELRGVYPRILRRSRPSVRKLANCLRMPSSF